MLVIELQNFGSYLCNTDIITYNSNSYFRFLSRNYLQFIGVCIITGRNEAVAKVIFLHLSVIHSVHRGVLPQCMLGYPPPRTRPPRDQTTPGTRPPWDQTPPRTRPPWTRHPPEQTPPPGADTPPWEADSSIRSTRGRYASYWNAFL